MQYLSEDTLAFRDIQIRVAELVGYASYASDGTAAPPTDAGRLDQIKRAINDAIAEIVLAVDAEGRIIRWSWKTLHVSIPMTVDGDTPANIDGHAGRLALPWIVRSAPKGRVTWSLDDGMSGVGVRVVDADSVERDWFARPQAKGPPVMCAVRPLPNSAGPGGRTEYELIVAPRPDQSYTLHLAFDIGAFVLYADGDRCRWFPEMDLLLVAWAASLLSPENEAIESRRMRLLVGAIDQNKQMVMSGVNVRENVDRYVRPVRVSVDGVRVI